MTINNYTQMSNYDICECINNIYAETDPRVLTVKYFSTHFPYLFQELVDRTIKLDKSVEIDYKITIRERLFWLEHDLTTHPTCQNQNCNNLVKWDKTQYKRYCCLTHALQDPEYHKRREQHCIDMYGVKNPMQLQEVKDRVCATMMMNHGVRHALQSESLLNKQKQTYAARTNEQRFQTRTKTINTCRERYHADSPMQSEEIKQKSIDTCNSKYGVDYTFQSESVKSKIKQSLIRNYGVDNPSKSTAIRQTVKQTMILRHGAEYYPQSEEYHRKAHNLYINDKYPSITFGSSWEFKVYDLLVEHNVEFRYQNIESIPYEYDGTQHLYFPDFQLTSNGQLIEVKGNHFFRINESTGEEEMFLPWKNPEWTDEYYQWKCGLYEAKHQCMIEHNVIVLREQQVSNLNIDMFTLQSV